MADKEDTREASPRNGWQILPGSPEWLEAERVCEATLRGFPELSTRDDVIHDALVEAARTYEGRNGAKFSTLACVVVRRFAVEALAHDELVPHEERIESVAMPDDVERRESPAIERGKIAALGRALEEFFAHEIMTVEALMFDARSDLAAYLRSSLGSNGLFAQCLRGHGWDPWPISFSDDFEAAVTAYASRVLGLAEVTLPDGSKEMHWVESEETLDAPLRIVGRRRADRYEARNDKSASRAFRQAIGEQRVRNAALVFTEMREDAARAIIKFAMKRAGVDGKVIHRALSGQRAEKVEKARRERDELIRAVADARREAEKASR